MGDYEYKYKGFNTNEYIKIQGGNEGTKKYDQFCVLLCLLWQLIAAEFTE